MKAPFGHTKKLKQAIDKQRISEIAQQLLEALIICNSVLAGREKVNAQEALNLVEKTDLLIKQAKGQ